MDDVALCRILRAYEIAPGQLFEHQKGYRNESHPFALTSGTRLNFIIYKREPGILQKIKDANRVADYLAVQGLPVRATYDTRILRIQAGGRVRYGSLYSYMPGRTIPWEGYTKQHIKLAGQAMSNMHAALQAMPQPPTVQVADEYCSIIDRLAAYFSDPDVVQAVRIKLHLKNMEHTLSDLRRIVLATKHLKGQQALHMDFVRGNILFSGSGDTLAISGILDFEKTAYGHPLFDIARTLAFLLVDCKYKPEHKIRKYFLQSGYAKRGLNSLPNITIKDISIIDRSLLDVLVDLFLLYDFYKFLRHNPYEYLRQNEHYVRTQQILINRNIIYRA